MDKKLFQSDVIDHVLGNDNLLSFEDQVVTTGFLSGLMQTELDSSFVNAVTGGEKKSVDSFNAMINFGRKVKEKLDAGGRHQFSNNILTFVDSCPNIAVEVNSSKPLLELAEQLDEFHYRDDLDMAM